MSILRDDAQKVADALAALKAHDDHTHEMTYAAPGRHTLEDWTERTVQRRRLSSVLEERASILARLVLAANP